MSVESDIARARKKPMPEDKLKELLAKARKRATGSFTTSKLVAVLDALGWQLQPIFAWTPMQYVSDGKELLTTQWTGQNPNPATVAAYKEMRQQYIEKAVTELPPASEATVGKRVIMDVGPMKIGNAGINYFEYRQWTGTGGVKIASPRGEEVEIFPDHHEVRRGTKFITEASGFATSDAWRWLISAGIEDDIAAALGTEKHIPAAQRTRDNTGTCAHCWGNYKLDDGRLVLHGYKRPRWGYTVGQCAGVRYQPLELSVAGAENALSHARRYLEGLKETLAALSAGKVDEIQQGRRTIKRGEHGFDLAVMDAIRRTKAYISDAQAEVTLYEKVIGNWRERPLPQARELQRGPGFFTKG